MKKELTLRGEVIGFKGIYVLTALYNEQNRFLIKKYFEHYEIKRIDCDYEGAEFWFNLKEGILSKKEEKENGE